MISFFIQTTASRISCKGQDGLDEDWFIMLKMPKKSNPNPLRAVGEAFFYMDPTSKLDDSESGVNHTEGNPLYYTTLPLYSKDSNIGYMLMSDQPANGKSVSDTYAHKKGILIFDKDNGIFIEHSTPRFPAGPESADAYEFPSNGFTYGQSFFCMTLTHEDLNGWGAGALIERPYVYSINLPSYTSSKMPNLIKIQNKKWNDEQMTRVQEINIGQHYIRLYSKHKDWLKDLYHDFLAPDLKTSTLSETWSNGVGTMGSNCTGAYHAYNIKKLQFHDQIWGVTNDHSKWAIADDFYCIGGVNRQEKQMERGGGCFCLKNIEFTKTIRDAVTYIEECDLQ